MAQARPTARMPLEAAGEALAGVRARTFTGTAVIVP